ncbi:MAG: type II toxin-antitoxin system Phd/YefM family antitoxin [Gemmatimonadetes bacterium]|nr:type II toxin-antitoxin system Phd/YefM family antitoxin [Gemmatimonadota bacterium]
MPSKRRRSVTGRTSKLSSPARPKAVAAGVRAEPAAPRAWMRLAKVSSTAAKNDFAGLVHRVERGSATVVMRHDRPAVVMLPLEDYESLTGADARQLDELTVRFDAELAAMNAPDVWLGTKQGFMARLDRPPVSRQRKVRARAGS